MSSCSEILTKILHIPGVGSKTAQKIAEKVNEGSFRDDEDLIELVQIAAHEIQFSKPINDAVVRDAFYKGEKVLEKNEKMGVKTISIFDDDYPSNLRNFKTNPPVLLHYKGDISSIKENPSCAVIGTRDPTENGYKVGVRVGELLAERKVIVISGLAKGCDTAGHTGCLNRNGKTIAVLAHGLKHLYPKENRKLADEILEKGGALITEYFYEQSARSSFFVERDRIQAGLSDNLFVVETGVKGGTMHTVKYALENDRKIFTYKHPEKYRYEDKAQGNQMLIKEDKATPVGNSEDFNILLNYITISYRNHYNGPHPLIPPFNNDIYSSFSITTLNYLDKFDFDFRVPLKSKNDQHLPKSENIVSKTDGYSPKTNDNSSKIKPEKRSVGKILKDLENEKQDKNSDDPQMNLWE